MKTHGSKICGQQPSKVGQMATVTVSYFHKWKVLKDVIKAFEIKKGSSNHKKGRKQAAYQK